MNRTHIRNVIVARAKVAPSAREWVDSRRTWDKNDMCPQERLQKAEQRLPAQYSPTSVLLRKDGEGSFDVLEQQRGAESPQSFTR